VAAVIEFLFQFRLRASKGSSLQQKRAQSWLAQKEGQNECSTDDGTSGRNGRLGAALGQVTQPTASAWLTELD
jgi:hypothetical protein